MRLCFSERYKSSLDRSPNKYLLPDLVNSPSALPEYSDPFQSYRHRCAMGKLVASRKSSTSSTAKGGPVVPRTSQKKS